MPRRTVPTPDYQLNDLVAALWIKRGRMLIEEQKLRAEPCRHQQRERLPLTSREGTYWMSPEAMTDVTAGGSGEAETESASDA